MKRENLLRRLCLLLVLPLAGLFWIPAAQADVIDDLADLLGAVEDAGVPPSWLPVKSGDLRNSKELIVCIDNANGSDKEIANCITTYHNTPIGSKLGGQAGIPSWVYDLLELYIDYREGDYWGVVKKLGEAAACIVAQVMVGGAVDVCGLIEDLIQTAKDLLNAAKAVGEFLASVGEAAYEAIKDVGCSLGLGGCGKSSPPEQIAYAWVFQPRVSQGLAAIEAIDPSGFYNLRSQLEQNALHHPPVWSIAGIPGWVYPNGLPKGAVDIASQVFTKAVDAQWSKDVVPAVLAKLKALRNQYASTSQVAKVAQMILAKHYTKAEQVGFAAMEACRQDFAHNAKVAHVDRWIQQHPGEAQTAKAQSHQQWCASGFLGGRKDDFRAAFRNHLKNTGCPEKGGGKLQCSSLENFEQCSALMGSVGQASVCSVSGAVGREVAQKIRAELIAKGSKYPCQVGYKLQRQSAARLLSGQAAGVPLVCSRPTLQWNCKDILATRYASLPSNLVRCELNMPHDYAALRKTVAQKVAGFNALSGMAGQYGINDYDPLIVLAASPAAVTAIEDLPDQDFGFGPPSSKKGFEYRMIGSAPKGVDGVNTPLLMHETKPPKPPIAAKNRLEEKMDIIDPRINPAPFENRMNPVQGLKGQAGLQSQLAPRGGFAAPVTGQQQLRSGKLPGGFAGPGAAAALGQAAGNLQALPGGGGFAPGAGGPDGSQLPQPKTLSGPLPGPLPGGGDSPRRAAPVTRMTPTVRPRVDLALGGQRLPWGQIRLSDTQANGQERGLCRFEMIHLWHGLTQTAGQLARRSWRVSPISASARRVSERQLPGGWELHDQLWLSPGENRLTLVAEIAGLPLLGPLTIQVDGNCSNRGRLGLPGRSDSGGGSSDAGDGSGSARSPSRLGLPGH